MNPLKVTEHLHQYGAGLERTTEFIFNNEDQNEYEFYLISLAEKIEDFHQIKKRNLGNELSELGDPAWKILLRLFITAKSEKKITITDLSQQLSFPEKTVLRYINILEDNGYIIQLHVPEQCNGWLQLTLQGQTKMKTTLLALSAF